tara:strand:+ start:180 stop:620 length:441 start_codon:yes stop_codon:yes gene_type:complete
MTKKLSRKKVLNLLNSQRHDGIYGAIKSGKDIPYYETSDDLNIWHNEHSSKDSLRISKRGLFEIKTLFKIFPIPMPKGFQVKNVHIKYLEQDVAFPYYLDNKMLILFSPKDALEIKLHNGDLDSWARSRWVNDRYQEPPQLPEEEQ